MDKTLVLATRNRKKQYEIEELLGDLPVEVVTLIDFPKIPDPVEDGKTFMENAWKKALFVAEKTGTYALADDSGLEVDALGGTPGIHSARYAGCDDKDKRDEMNNKKLLEDLKGVPDGQRTARFRCAIALAGPSPENPRKIVKLGEAEGEVEGRILTELRGTSGFGYDPLFFCEELGCTFGEAWAESKNSISHRAKALAKIAPLLAKIFRETSRIEPFDPSANVEWSVPEEPELPDTVDDVDNMDDMDRTTDDYDR